ncbi:MAG: hypothetical protein WBX15_20715 [Thermoanaerobaculia bacterium]
MTEIRTGSGESDGRTGASGRSLLPLLVGIALLLLLLFSSQFVIIFLLLRRAALPLLAALAVGMAAQGIGAGFRTMVDSLAGIRSEARGVSAIATDLLIGAPLFGTLTFLVALLSANLMPMLAVTFVALAGGAVALRSYSFTREVEWSPSSTEWFASATALIAFLLAGVLSLLPPIDLDELAYHLAVPRIWILEGRSIGLPLISHSWFPLGIESATLPLLAALRDEGGLAAHFFALLLAIATSLVVFNWIHRASKSRAAALAGTIAILGTPALLITAGWLWVDVPLVGMSMILFASLDERDAGRRSPGIIAGALAAGLLTKYTFIPLALLLLGAAFARRRFERREWMALGCGALAGSVFFIRNLALAGNPFAPFFSSLAPRLTGYRAGGGWPEVVRNYIFDGRMIDESIGVAILIAAMGAVLLLALSRLRFAAVAAGAMALLAVGLGSLEPSSRILLPPLAIVAAAGSAAIGLRIPTARSARLLLWMMIVAGGFQLLLGIWYASTLDPLRVAFGVETESEYLRTHRRFFSDVEKIDALLPHDSRTLVIGLNEIYWFSHQVRGGGNFDSPRMAEILDAPDAIALRDKLRRSGFTHVMIVPDGVVAGDPTERTHAAERATILPPTVLAVLKGAFPPGVAVVRTDHAMLFRLE